MRILLVASAYNGLCQRAHVELLSRGDDVSVTLALGDDVIRQAVELHQPELIICPFLKERLPEDLWRQHLCIIIHPGIRGDRGPSSLDWAIMNGEREWGVTALAAAAEMDAGDIWSSVTFPMRPGSKASLYRREVTQAGIQAILETIERFESGTYRPEPLDYSNPDIRGELRPSMKQATRAIAWECDTTAQIIQKIRASDSAPGVLDVIDGREYYLYGAHAEGTLRGAQPGAILAQRHGAICRATTDGAVWITHLKAKKLAEAAPGGCAVVRLHKAPTCKLPATMVLEPSLVAEVPEVPCELFGAPADETWKEIWYEEANGVGYLHFDFYNGAMSTPQCRRLQEAYREALARDIRVLVLMGGADFWSNGIHLNVIDAAMNPATESWHNINAIDNIVRDVIVTDSVITVAAMWGNAGAGGVMMPLAADHVWARAGAVLNPHYRSMGLYGSEYWTYLLPRRVGVAKALELTGTPLPLGTQKALEIGLVDAILPDDLAAYHAEVRARAEALAASADFEQILEAKRQQRAFDEKVKPLAAYRVAELQRMRLDFAGRSSYQGVTYHEARRNFVDKVKAVETAPYLAKHLQALPAKVASSG